MIPLLTHEEERGACPVGILLSRTDTQRNPKKEKTRGGGVRSLLVP